jgi:hypothetical protein
MQALSPGATGRSPLFTLAERFEFGNFTIREVRELKNISHSGFYADMKRGLVKIEKWGARSIVRGPVAKRYIQATSKRATTDPDEGAPVP